jgi:hypothetical protein
MEGDHNDLFDFPNGVVFGDPGVDVDHRHKLPSRLLPASDRFYRSQTIDTRFIPCFSSAC